MQESISPILPRLSQGELTGQELETIVRYGSNQAIRAGKIKSQEGNQKSLPFGDKKTNPFTTFEDIVILLNDIVEYNHTPESMRMRRNRLKEAINGEMGKFLAADLEKKRKMLALKLNGRNGERIQVSPSKKELLDKIESINRKLNKISRKLNIETGEAAE